MDYTIIDEEFSRILMKARKQQIMRGFITGVALSCAALCAIYVGASQR